MGRGAEGREGEGEGHDCGLARMPEHASRTAEDSTITPEYSQLPTLSLFCLLCMLDSVGCVLCVMCTRACAHRRMQEPGHIIAMCGAADSYLVS